MLGALIAGVGGPASLWVAHPADGHPASAGTSPAAAHGPALRASLRGALADRRLFILEGAWFSLGLVFMTVTVHSVPFARDLGLPLDRASLTLSAYGLGSAVGRIAAGVTADRLGASLTLRACALVQGTALAALIAGPPAWALAVIVVAFGVGAAGADTAFVKVVPDVFGLGALATVMSVLSLGWRLGAAVGPAGAGFLYDLTGSYTLPFGVAFLTLLLAVLLFGFGTRGARGGAPV